MPQKYIYNELILKIESKLSIIPDKREENVENTLRALWHTAAGNRVSAITATKMDLPFLSSSQLIFLNEMVDSRLHGIPLAHLTERQNFMGLDYILNRGHYIPRKETELLAKISIDSIIKEYFDKEKIIVLDLCSGIGTIGLAVAHYCKNVIVYGSDIYKPAIEAAKINTKNFGLESRTSFYQGDLFDSFEQLNLENRADLVICAPPYISSVKVKQMASEIADHEPSEAFDAGPFGLSVFNKLISIAPDYLHDNGYLIFECGLGQGEFLATRLNSNAKYSETTKICDHDGNIRVLKAKKSSEKF